MNRKIFKTGHSAAVTLSQKLLKGMELKVGDTVKIELDEQRGELIIRHCKRDSQLPLNLKIRPSLGSSSLKQ
jgi:antitoxin component of MazEF toxin-antitoxin module